MLWLNEAIIKHETDNRRCLCSGLLQIETVDQRSTRILPPSRRGSSGQCVECKWTSFKITELLTTHTQLMCSWSLDFMFNAKLKLQSRNLKIQYGCQSAILKVTLLKINRLLSIETSNLLLKFALDIQSQTKLKSPETEKSNMADRRPFWKWHLWKSIDFFTYTKAMCYWSLDLIFKAKLKLEYRNWKIRYGHQAAILKVTNMYLKIIRLWPMATNNMHMKFEIATYRVQIPKNPIWPPGGHFWKGHPWKSIGFFPRTQIMCY